MTAPKSSTDNDIESVEAFGARARAWIQDNLKRSDPKAHIGVMRVEGSDEEEVALVAREREVQRMFYDAGFAGICIPREYGGRGLTRAHLKAFDDALGGYEYPARLQSPTFAPCVGVLLDYGTEEQKKQHIPAILKGEEIWMQFLSEPSGGSDVAGALTTAVRDGDEWVLNGSKIWTTGAWWSDWALCLARTNWDVPKHRGLTVFMLPLRQPGIEVHRIELLNGSREFCQEYMTDVRVPDSDRVGEIDNGWKVGTGWMFHERMAHHSPYTTMPAGSARGGSRVPELIEVLGDSGRTDDPIGRDLIGEARMFDIVKDALQQRVSQGIAKRTISDQAASLARLMAGVAAVRWTSIGYELTEANGAAWDSDDGAVADRAVDNLMRQVSTIAGGTTEMARNAISERLLGMPREHTHDVNLAFRDVPRGRSGS
ncbi:UNVERIFIED_CONTAM: alkylation response protein AidB-like acyl-CoA dehydrogenase [Williamsia faeni]